MNELSLPKISGKITKQTYRQWLAQVEQGLNAAETPPEIKQVEAAAELIEKLANDTGLFSDEDIRPANEVRMRARWKLGRALASEERGQGKRTDLTLSRGETKLFRKRLVDWGIDKSRALEAQRIGTLPAAELDKLLDQARKQSALTRIADLLRIAKPWWYKEKRAQKHKTIAGKAAATASVSQQFTLIYADPPWTFETYHPAGHESNRMPDQHYPVMSDSEIADLTIGDRAIRDLVYQDAALFMWCTSSNLHRALPILEAWGFNFKTSAVWDKMQIGTGLIFRNQHELLLYADRGKMPKPVEVPSSVFRYQRTAHSAKPPEIRQTLERMYPFFGKEQRAELFSRGEQDGWTSFGNEAGN